MPFKFILQDLVESTGGATGAILIDWEGEAVELYSPAANEFDIKILGAHQNIIFNRIREIRQRVPSQAINNTVITTDQQHLILGAIGDDYTLVTTLERNALVGRALVSVQRAIKLLEKEIY
ncbi:MAG: roadblock/LC7 domain-containing protein [Geobacteraceae bacterium]|nr:roadblock/LC7 domain-containing protein [Geobacteraceae bacterium]